MPASLRRHNPPAVHPPLGRYHHATVHPLGGGLKRLVMAGQVGIKPDGTLPADLAGQIEQAYDNLLAVLASEGMSANDLVKITYFTTDKSPEALKLSRDIRVRKLGDANPSSTYLVIAGLAGPDLKVEIEGEAVGLNNSPAIPAKAGSGIPPQAPAPLQFIPGGDADGGLKALAARWRSARAPASACRARRGFAAAG